MYMISKVVLEVIPPFGRLTTRQRRVGNRQEIYSLKNKQEGYKETQHLHRTAFGAVQVRL
jgi:hypothetical protein